MKGADSGSGQVLQSPSRYQPFVTFLATAQLAVLLGERHGHEFRKLVAPSARVSMQQRVQRQGTPALRSSALDACARTVYTH